MRFMRNTGMLTMSPYWRAMRCNVPSASWRTSSARPSIGKPLGPGGAWFPLLVILDERSSLHPRVVGNVKPAENAVNNHPQNRVVNAPGQSDREHAAESPDADSCRTPAATVAHGNAPFARKRVQPG